MARTWASSEKKFLWSWKLDSRDKYQSTPISSFFYSCLLLLFSLLLYIKEKKKIKRKKTQLCRKISQWVETRAYILYTPWNKRIAPISIHAPAGAGGVSSCIRTLFLRALKADAAAALLTRACNLICSPGTSDNQWCAPSTALYTNLCIPSRSLRLIAHLYRVPGLQTLIAFCQFSVSY